MRSSRTAALYSLWYALSKRGVLRYLRYLQARTCLTQLPDGTQFWNYPTCVAAAITTGVCLLPSRPPHTLIVLPQVDQLTDLGYCQTNITAPPAPAELPVLNQDVFDSMAKTCADDGTCGISQQNFVDFVYGQIEENGITVTPEYVFFFDDPLYGYADARDR